MKPYHEHLALAQRFDKVVDFGSPMSAWTPEMLAQRTGETMKTGTLNRDVEHYNPRCNCGGTIKAGTPVVWVERASLWAVKYRSHASFMNQWDWAHSYVDVPADAVTITEPEKP